MNIIKKGFTQHHKAGAGFTLVELLIVISLLGAIALIVIAAINPIEQSNRARDSRFKGDSSQLLSAIQRYYASRGASASYPWMDVDNGATYNGPEDPYGFQSAADPNVGICATGAGCPDGVLVTSNEILDAFKNRDFVTTTNDDNRIYVGKATGSGSTPFACFIPSSLSAKQEAATKDKIWNLTKATSNGTRTLHAGLCKTAPTTANWGTGAGGLSCYVCVPE